MVQGDARVACPVGSRAAPRPQPDRHEPRQEDDGSHTPGLDGQSVRPSVPRGPRSPLPETRSRLAKMRAREAPPSIPQERGYPVHLPEERIELPLVLELAHIQLEEHAPDGDRDLVTEGYDFAG